MRKRYRVTLTALADSTQEQFKDFLVSVLDEEYGITVADLSVEPIDPT